MDSQNTPSRPPLLIPRSGRRRFLISFIGLTILGFAIGGVLTVIVNLAADRFIFNGAIEPVSPGGVAKEVLVGLLLGATIGTAQWFELRRHLKSSYLWILANSLGYVATSNALFLILLLSLSSSALTQLPSDFLGLFAISMNQNPANFLPVIGLGFLLAASWSGVVIGMPQWLVLRKSSQPIWWWILAMIVPGAIASSFWVMMIAAAQFVPSANVSGVLTYLAIASFAVHSTVYGVVQGVSLCACRQKVERIQS
jgi:hypothetical protein